MARGVPVNALLVCPHEYVDGTCVARALPEAGTRGVWLLSVGKTVLLWRGGRPLGEAFVESVKAAEINRADRLDVGLVDDAGQVVWWSMLGPRMWDVQSLYVGQPLLMLADIERGGDGAARVRGESVLDAGVLGRVGVRYKGVRGSVSAAAISQAVLDSSRDRGKWAQALQEVEVALGGNLAWWVERINELTCATFRDGLDWLRALHFPKTGSEALAAKRAAALTNAVVLLKSQMSHCLGVAGVPLGGCASHFKGCLSEGAQEVFTQVRPGACCVVWAELGLDLVDGVLAVVRAGQSCGRVAVVVGDMRQAAHVSERIASSLGVGAMADHVEVVCGAAVARAKLAVARAETVVICASAGALWPVLQGACAPGSRRVLFQYGQPTELDCRVVASGGAVLEVGFGPSWVATREQVLGQLGGLGPDGQRVLGVVESESDVQSALASLGRLVPAAAQSLVDVLPVAAVDGFDRWGLVVAIEPARWSVQALTKLNALSCVGGAMAKVRVTGAAGVVSGSGYGECLSLDPVFKGACPGVDDFDALDPVVLPEGVLGAVGSKEEQLQESFF